MTGFELERRALSKRSCGLNVSLKGVAGPDMVFVRSFGAKARAARAVRKSILQRTSVNVTEPPSSTHTLCLLQSHQVGLWAYIICRPSRMPSEPQAVRIVLTTRSGFRTGRRTRSGERQMIGAILIWKHCLQKN